MSSKARCLTHDLWEGLEKQIYNYLHSISLADLRSKKFVIPPSGFTTHSDSLSG